MYSDVFSVHIIGRYLDDAIPGICLSNYDLSFCVWKVDFRKFYFIIFLAVPKIWIFIVSDANFFFFFFWLLTLENFK